jgi:hypothetical protein
VPPTAPVTVEAVGRDETGSDAGNSRYWSLQQHAENALEREEEKRGDRERATATEHEPREVVVLAHDRWLPPHAPASRIGLRARVVTNPGNPGGSVMI